MNEKTLSNKEYALSMMVVISMNYDLLKKSDENTYATEGICKTHPTTRFTVQCKQKKI